MGFTPEAVGIESLELFCKPLHEMRRVDLTICDLAIGSSSPHRSSTTFELLPSTMSYENTNKVEGEPLSLGSQVLDTAAKTLQVVIRYVCL